MSNYETKMKQLGILRSDLKGFSYRLISYYQKKSDEDKKAYDDNADILLEQYLNTDIQKINKNIKTLTTITIVYVIVTIIAVAMIFLALLFKN